MPYAAPCNCSRSKCPRLPGEQLTLNQTILSIHLDAALVQVGHRGAALAARSRLVGELEAAVLQPRSNASVSKGMHTLYVVPEGIQLI